jgi:peroxiredoxin
MLQPLLIMSIVLLWIIVLLNLVLTLGIVRRLNNTSLPGHDPIAENRLQSGDPAPAFSAETLDGQQVSLETYAGQAVAFHFLSIHCEPCREVLPDLLTLAPLAWQAGVQFIFVVLDDAQNTRAFVEEYQIPSPVIVAPRPGNDYTKTNEFAQAYKSKSTPSYCLIDEEGLVLSAGHPRTGDWKKWEMVWRKQLPKGSEKVSAERR